MLVNQLTQLERVLTWLLRRGGLLTLIRPGLAGALRVRNVLRGRSVSGVPVLSGRMRPEVLLFLPAGDVQRGMRPREIERQLWGGYSRYALEELEALATGRDVAPQWRAEACWVLARWHSARGDFQRALDYAVLMRSARPAEAWFKGQILLEVDCLNRLGRGDEARAILDQVTQVIQWHADYALAYANTYWGGARDSEERLVWINRGFEAAGVAPIERVKPDGALAIDNLSAPAAAADSRAGGPVVSVLMPAFNSAATIEKALRGLLKQTWANLEIIAVDDCSTDETWHVLQDFAREDSRVRPLKHEVNTGAYGARLTALTHARGDFITVHDADDWSHPQKIETQVEAMLAEPDVVATMTSWCRVSYSMYVNRVGAIPSGNLQRQNESSLMFRRALVDVIGAWDKVRAAADTEFIWRIQAAYGKAAVKVVHPDVPLSFSLSQDDSLTRTGPTHVRTIFFGTRRNYREAQRWWHRHAGARGLRLDPEATERLFPAPRNLLTRKPEPRDYDLVFVGDFTMLAGVGQYQQSLVEAAVEQGLSVALFHWRRYEEPALRPVRDRYYALAAEGRLDILASEDAAQANTLIVTDAMAVRHLLDVSPSVEAQKILVATGHEKGSRFPDQIGFDPSEVIDNVAAAFGGGVQWLPVSSWDAERLREDARFSPVSDDVLPALVPASFLETSLEANVGEKRPVVGRFGTGTGTAWPSDGDVLRAAYCANRECSVKLHGIDREVLAGLGRLPRNWEVDNRLSSHEQTAADANYPELDFFLYYPDPAGGIEAAGLPMLQAMALGQLIVTAPCFRAFFQDGAVYAEPGEVAEVVSGLWADSARLTEQREAGRAFVRTHAHPARIRGVLECVSAEVSC